MKKTLIVAFLSLLLNINFQVSNADNVNQLERLKKLLDSGAITEEVFEKAKKRLLGKENAAKEEKKEEPTLVNIVKDNAQLNRLKKLLESGAITQEVFEKGMKRIFAEEEREKQELLAKQKAEEERKKQELLAKQKAEEERKKQEFLAKQKEIDKDAPIVEIAQNITVNNTEYKIKGKVKDKSDRVFIEIDGQTIVAENGKFVIERFSPIDEQIKIVAIDEWGNKSKPKIVNIKIDIANSTTVRLEKLNPTKIKATLDNNKVALIFGIENYTQAPKATFANLDAKYFYEYANKAFGVPRANIKLLTDNDANLIQSLGTLSKWLPGKIKSGKTELILFFAGHGLATNDGEELYLLPQDSDPDLLDRTALSRSELFKNIIDLNPKSVTMFFDTCFSGVSRDEETLLASARPIMIVADEQKDTLPDNFTVFSASQLDQLSSGLKEAEHGIFSYFLMKGLEGKADSNQDKKITNGELLSYMNENVSQKAAELGREQNPSLAGDPDKVLISYR